MRSFASTVATGLPLIVGVMAAASVTAGEQPRVSDVNIDKPFKQAYPGNVVTITLKARHPQGVQRVFLMAKWSHYEGGHDELMAGDIELTPTGQADEFRGSFAVPAKDPNTQQPLPAAGYRVMVTRIHDGQGANVYHAYMVIGHISFNPRAAIRVYAEPTGPAAPDAEGRIDVIIENSMATEQDIDLQVRVFDHFQKVVASQDVPALKVAPGRHERVLAAIAKDTKRLRAEAS